MQYEFETAGCKFQRIGKIVRVERICKGKAKRKSCNLQKHFRKKNNNSSAFRKIIGKGLLKQIMKDTDINPEELRKK